MKTPFSKFGCKHYAISFPLAAIEYTAIISWEFCRMTLVAHDAGNK